MKNKILLLLLAFVSLAFTTQQALPEGFVYAKTIVPDIDVELRYFSANNFVGDTIPGYNANKLIVSLPTAQALKNVQEELAKQNLCLRVYDAYRPQQAVNYFIKWAKNLEDTRMKPKFYPEVEKKHLFRDGYIASRSGHSRGSTVDLTIIDANTLEPLDMGSPFDFFGMASWVAYSKITAEQKANRTLLQEVMNKYGFRSYSKEWWHFTLRNEPFPNTYFDFEIE
ncbi:M15 family metallopeptidase [Bizionia sp. KMM 8389]